MKYDTRHRRVIEQMLIAGSPLSFEDLQRKAQMRRSDDEFGLVMGDLAAKKIIDCRSIGMTRYYRIRPSVRAAAEAAA